MEQSNRTLRLSRWCRTKDIELSRCVCRTLANETFVVQTTKLVIQTMVEVTYCRATSHEVGVPKISQKCDVCCFHRETKFKQTVTVGLDTSVYRKLAIARHPPFSVLLVMSTSHSPYPMCRRSLWLLLRSKYLHCFNPAPRCLILSEPSISAHRRRALDMAYHGCRHIGLRQTEGSKGPISGVS